MTDDFYTEPIPTLGTDFVSNDRADRLVDAIANNHSFIRLCQTTIDSAITADGRIPAHPGHSRCITSDQARNASFLPKSRQEAILARIETNLHNYPLLTSRLPRGGIIPIQANRT